MTAVVISQPMLFPWPGFFEQLALADGYIYLDDAQFSKGSFTNRIQLLKGNDRCWMTIPLAGKGSFQKIQDLSATADNWRASHRSLLRQSLDGAPYIDDALAILDEVYANDSLCDLLIASTEVPARYLGIGFERIIRRSCDMASNGTSWQRVLDLVLEANGTRYLTGHGAANYLDHQAFEAAGVYVEYMNYSCTPWPQPRETFTPYVSVLDLIARTGPDARKHLLPKTISWREFLKEEASVS
ncbi:MULTISPECIES: WbqC family protein [Ensifer]|uniref:WbqC family protein n=1 Tax=Ensifer TaxID=106591 RepID=UPI000DC47093|nr:MULTISPECIES: WbqC family protein [Ensifer]MBD9625591.1 WbqC family protein [Ensifer sp. ENS06]RAS11625.1 WbqC-like protein [Ensifer adhaerens]